MSSPWLWALLERPAPAAAPAGAWWRAAAREAEAPDDGQAEPWSDAAADLKWASWLAFDARDDVQAAARAAAEAASRAFPLLAAAEAARAAWVAAADSAAAAAALAEYRAVAEVAAAAEAAADAAEVAVDAAASRCEAARRVEAAAAWRVAALAALR